MTELLLLSHTGQRFFFFFALSLPPSTLVGRGSKTFQDFPRGRLIYLVDTNSGSYTTGVLINIHTAAKTARGLQGLCPA